MRRVLSSHHGFVRENYEKMLTSAPIPVKETELKLEDSSLILLVL